MSDAVRGNFGKSFLAGQPAMGLIFERFPATLELAFVVAGALARWSACRWASMPGCGRNPPGSKAIMTGSILGFSLPNFWVGLMLIMVFAVCCPTCSRAGPAAGLGPRRRPSMCWAWSSRS